MPLMMFYGKECPHCERMTPLIDQLEKEEGVKVERLETWHDQANAEKLAQLDNGDCGGVPFFVNTETNAKICGAVDYDHVKIWAGK